MPPQYCPLCPLIAEPGYWSEQPHRFSVSLLSCFSWVPFIGGSLTRPLSLSSVVRPHYAHTNMNEIIAFAAAVSHATNIAKAIVSTRDETKLAALNLEFTSAVLELTQKQLVLSQHQQTLLTENETLKKQLAAYERWEQESRRYQLHQLEPGILVYALKPEHAAAQPAHWLCATCYQDRKASILHPDSKGSDVLVCPRDPQHQLITGDRSGCYAA